MEPTHGRRFVDELTTRDAATAAILEQCVHVSCRLSWCGVWVRYPIDLRKPIPSRVYAPTTMPHMPAPPPGTKQNSCDNNRGNNKSTGAGGGGTHAVLLLNDAAADKFGRPTLGFYQGRGACLCVGFGYMHCFLICFLAPFIKSSSIFISPQKIQNMHTRPRPGIPLGRRGSHGAGDGGLGGAGRLVAGV